MKLQLVCTTALLVLITACAHRPDWQHQTLRGVEADAKLDADHKQCEDATPHSLPAGIYNSVHGGFNTYDSQNGRASGNSKKSQSARTSTGEGGHRGTAAPLDTSKMDDVQRRNIYEQCMAQRGWVPPDKAQKTTPATPEKTSAQPSSRPAARPATSSVR